MPPPEKTYENADKMCHEWEVRAGDAVVAYQVALRSLEYWYRLRVELKNTEQEKSP